jgi:acyl phosphate:glycerol-3-phosphate acyltransferase
MMPALALVAAYCIGAIPFGFLLVKWRTGGDIRESGSGNIGATNVLRSAGWQIGVATLALDIAKGYFAVWLAGWLSKGDPIWMAAAALVVMAGHAFPLFLGGKGGKAVASFVGAYLCLTPLPLLATIVVFVAMVAWTRYISVGSIVAAGAFPLAVWLISHPPLPVTVAAVISGVFIIYRHKGNIARLRAGNENVFSLRRSVR